MLDARFQHDDIPQDYGESEAEELEDQTMMLTWSRTRSSIPGLSRWKRVMRRRSYVELCKILAWEFGGTYCYERKLSNNCASLLL